MFCLNLNYIWPLGRNIVPMSQVRVVQCSVSSEDGDDNTDSLEFKETAYYPTA